MNRIQEVIGTILGIIIGTLTVCGLISVVWITYKTREITHFDTSIIKVETSKLGNKVIITTPENKRVSIKSNLYFEGDSIQVKRTNLIIDEYEIVKLITKNTKESITH